MLKMQQFFAGAGCPQETLALIEKELRHRDRIGLSLFVKNERLLAKKLQKAGFRVTTTRGSPPSAPPCRTVESIRESQSALSRRAHPARPASRANRTPKATTPAPLRKAQPLAQLKSEELWAKLRNSGFRFKKQVFSSKSKPASSRISRSGKRVLEDPLFSLQRKKPSSSNVGNSFVTAPKPKEVRKRLKFAKMHKSFDTGVRVRDGVRRKLAEALSFSSECQDKEILISSAVAIEEAVLKEVLKGQVPPEWIAEKSGENPCGKDSEEASTSKKEEKQATKKKNTKKNPIQKPQKSTLLKLYMVRCRDLAFNLSTNNQLRRKILYMHGHGGGLDCEVDSDDLTIDLKELVLMKNAEMASADLKRAREVRKSHEADATDRELDYLIVDGVKCPKCDGKRVTRHENNPILSWKVHKFTYHCIDCSGGWAC